MTEWKDWKAGDKLVCTGATMVESWIGTTNAALEIGDGRLAKTLAVAAMAIWPLWIIGWLMTRAWRRDAWR